MECDVTFVPSIVSGGLTAVIYTDAVQTVIMVIGALTLMFIGSFQFSKIIYSLSFGTSEFAPRIAVLFLC